MVERSAGEEGLFAALKNTLLTLLGIGKTRAELLVLEIEEEKYRLISMWSKAIGAAFMLAIGLIMAAFALALAFWEYRVLVFGLIAALFMLGSLVLVLMLRHQAKQPSKLFRSSLAELEADMVALRGLPADRE
ncbi:MAG: phage holin family protein [Azonexus sp.]|nr:phage holin family protein [Azonexus sp.]